MASTRLVRKALRNRTVSKKRVNAIKRLTSKPVIKNIDIEQIKEEFANKPAKPAAKKEEAPVKEAPAAEPKAEIQEAAPKGETKKVENKVETAAPEAKEEKKSTAKKVPAKKAAPKAKKEAAPKAKKKEDKAE